MKTTKTMIDFSPEHLYPFLSFHSLLQISLPIMIVMMCLLHVSCLLHVPRLCSASASPFFSFFCRSPAPATTSYLTHTHTHTFTVPVPCSLLSLPLYPFDHIKRATQRIHTHIHNTACVLRQFQQRFLRSSISQHQSSRQSH